MCVALLVCLVNEDLLEAVVLKNEKAQSFSSSDWTTTSRTGSSFLCATGVQEADERKMCLDWAQEAGLDVSSITKLVVENIRNRDRINLQTDSEMPLDTGTTEVVYRSN